MKKCPVCQKEDAIIHPAYGVLPGLNCKNRRANLNLPDVQVEMTSDSIRSDRKAYAKSILQPFRAGEASREFMEAYPEKAKEIYTKMERKKAKNVWKDTFGSVDISKTK